MAIDRTTSAAAPTISGKVKKNGLSWPPVRKTRDVAKVRATDPLQDVLRAAEGGGRQEIVDEEDEQPGARRAG